MTITNHLFTFHRFLFIYLPTYLPIGTYIIKNNYMFDQGYFVSKVDVTKNFYINKFIFYVISYLHNGKNQ